MKEVEYNDKKRKNYHCLNICKSLLCKGEDLMCVHSFGQAFTFLTHTTIY